MNLQAQRDISRKLKVFEHAATSGNIAFTCRHFGISRDTFYQWKRAYAARGEKGLINSKPCPENPTSYVPPPLIEEKILYLRRNYHFG
jgi:transposase-like protein